jgi:hypothetical protein
MPDETRIRAEDSSRGQGDSASFVQDELCLAQRRGDAGDKPKRVQLCSSLRLRVPVRLCSGRDLRE